MAYDVSAMPDDRQRQLDALKRSMCGDCGVGPFKGGRTGAGVPRRVVWGVGIGLLLAGAVVAACVILR